MKLHSRVQGGVKDNTVPYRVPTTFAVSRGGPGGPNHSDKPYPTEAVHYEYLT